MRNNPLVAAGVCVVISICAIAWTQAQQPPLAPASSTVPVEDLLKVIRGDLQNTRADIVAKNVDLTSAQSRQFWPLFETYQKEQSLIMDDQLTQVQWYIENFEKADDAAALKLIHSHFERDIKMTALRQSWLAEFQKVLGAKLAVRVMQIDRRVSLTQQAYIASKIPLSY